MAVKFMIIDSQAAFRRLLAHHLRSRWSDASISEYDPASAGPLPAEFSGAGSDAILLGSRTGENDSFNLLARFRRRPGFPPVVYLGAEEEEDAALRLGASRFVERDGIRHDAFVATVANVLASPRHAASTAALFDGDREAGTQPLIRGYRLVQRLSESPHSSVFLATRESGGRKVILKVLHQVPDVADGDLPFDRFLREFELIAEIDHPNIVRIFDLGISDDHAHIAMEYLDGGDLKQRIASGIHEGQALRYLREIASALQTVHAVGILHRDLKPANVMLRNDDSVALIDFGLARQMRMATDITRAGDILGTPYYMSPEQGHGDEVDARSDLYALGVIFYEMLTGEKPYAADTAMGIIYKHARAPVPLLPPYLAKHQVLINMLMAKRPEDRLQSAAEIEEWL